MNNFKGWSEKIQSKSSDSYNFLHHGIKSWSVSWRRWSWLHDFSGQGTNIALELLSLARSPWGFGVLPGLVDLNMENDAPWCWNIYLQNCVMIGANVGHYSITMVSGSGMENDDDVSPYFTMFHHVSPSIPGWWFQSPWKIWVNWDDYFQYMEK